MKNKFNNLTSKEWLPFQKSWFIETSTIDTYRANLKFFVKFDAETPPNVLFWGSKENNELISRVADEIGANVYSYQNIQDVDNLQFVLIDVRDIIEENPTIENYSKIRQEVIKICNACIEKLNDRRFISVFIQNIYKNGSYYPIAWELSKTLSTGLSLKDEKIGCYDKIGSGDSPYVKGNIYYSLYFRKDESSSGLIQTNLSKYFLRPNSNKVPFFNTKPISNWHIIKPKPRNKVEILHPAKYPEELVELFLDTFTQEKDNVFDPMSGSGSTQYAALSKDRNAYGTELSPFFGKIAINRLNEFIEPSQLSLFKVEKSVKFNILIKDARQIKKNDFPTIDYIITSPPYWDMLNMKGAEYQARRKEMGLQLNYSDDNKDLGNLSVYEEFINDLCEIYFNLFDILKEGGIMTIIVKNIKKKGKNYPFAYDLSEILQKQYILLPEVFWCQDDINLAPYGYGNTFVSNTFHQYCLNFQKPIS